jgi:hypothetical protein
VEIKGKYQVNISNRFIDFDNLEDDVESLDINRAWKIIRENIKASATQNLGYYEMKQQKHGFMKSAQNY